MRQNYFCEKSFTQPTLVHNSGGRPSKKGLYAAVGGTALAALCCFTPILLITLGAVGLGAFTPYLDYLLFPALAIMIVVSFLAYRKYKNRCASGEVISSN